MKDEPLVDNLSSKETNALKPNKGNEKGDIKGFKSQVSVITNTKHADDNQHNGRFGFANSKQIGTFMESDFDEPFKGKRSNELSCHEEVL